MNKCILTGRLTKTPELKTTANGKNKCEFILAVNRPVVRDGQREADFLSCEAWGKTAENLVNYQKKGSLIAVIGSVRKMQYEKEDGSRAYYDFVLANEIEFLQGKVTAVDEVEEITITASKENVNPFEVYEEFEASISIDENDLPF